MNSQAPVSKLQGQAALHIDGAEASCTGAGGSAIGVRHVLSRRCAAFFRESSRMCRWVVQYALKYERKP